MFSCRSCLSKHIDSIIPLGKLPLANKLLDSLSNINSEAKYNLEVMLCMDCGLAQLRDLVDPKELFSNYVYFSSNSDTMLKSAESLVNQIIPTLPKNAFIIEIASNDGYLLKNYVAKEISVLGIEPAQNIVKTAIGQGITSLCEFFSEDLALNLASSGKQADVIHANNVMAHVPDINGFIKGLKYLLKPNGYVVIEVPYFLDLVQKLEFDTIYHEHVFYFAVKPLKLAFERHGLEIFDIQKINIHGGTIRLFVDHANNRVIQPVVFDMLHNEENARIYTTNLFLNFMHQIQQLRQSLISTLSTIKKQGGKIAAYGASAKGTTLLNYFGINNNYLDFVVDKSRVKQGLFTPGTCLEIKHPQAFIVEKITHALLLVWNFAEEIITQQKDFITSNGKFIFPLPKVEIFP